MVTTGTLTTALTMVLPGETWETEVEGIALPGMTVAFDR